MSIQTELARLTNAKAAIQTAIEGKGVTVPDGTLLDGMASLIEGIEAGGGGGYIFGTSKYQAGSVIAKGAAHIIVPKPTWYTDLSKLNFVLYTKATMTWDGPYYTMLIRIIRDAVNIELLSVNDNKSPINNTFRIQSYTDNITINTDNSYYSMTGYEYFYLLWENE